MRFVGNRLAAILAALVMFGPSDAGADDKSEREARKLFKDGNELLDRGSYVDALDRFNRAYALWQNPKILINIATSYRQLGRWAEAADAFERYLSMPGADPKRRAEVDAALKELAGKYGTVRIEVTEPGAKVLLDGKPVSTAGLTMRVDPGPHTVIVEKDGFTPVAATVTVAAGEARSVSLKLVSATPVAASAASSAPLPPSPPPAAASIPPPPVASSAAPLPLPPRAPERTRPASDRLRTPAATTGYVIGGVGVVLTAVGAYYGWRAHSKWSQARDEHCSGRACDEEGLSMIDDAKSSAWVSNIGIGLGLIGIGLGGYMLWGSARTNGPDSAPVRAPLPSARSSLRLQATPVIGARSGGFAIGGVW